ncbi:MAG: PAS domain S-box protein [Chloroflexi bacterium]|nr:PAS domain S-box protein [Chloroflexota bacterium]
MNNQDKTKPTSTAKQQPAEESQHAALQATHALRESEHKFATAFMASPDSILITRVKDGKVIEANERFLQIIGYTRDEILGKTAAEIQNWADANNRQRFVDTLRETGQVENMETQFRNKDGTVSDYLISARPLMVGGEQCVISITRDISERKRAEQARRTSEASYRSIFNSVNDMIFVHDIKTGRLLDVNAKTIEVFGYTRKEFLPMRVEDWSQGTSPYSNKEARQWIAQAAMGTPQIFPWICKKKDGELFWTEVSLKKAIYQGTENILAVVRDITERKQAEETLRRYTKQLETLHQMSQDLGSLYHDPETLLFQIVERGVKLVNADRGSIYMYRPKSQILDLTARYNLSFQPTGITMERGEGLAGKVWDTGEALIVDDYGSWPGRSPQWADYEIGTIIGVPIKWGDEFLGIMNTHFNTREDNFTSENVELLSHFANFAAIAINNMRLWENAKREIAERKQAEAALQEQTYALRESEKRAKQRQMYLERVLAAAPDAIVTMDPNYQIIEWNPGAEKLFGYLRHETIGRNLDNLITSPSVLEEAVGFTQVAMQGQDIGPVEIVRHRKDGSSVDTILASSPIFANEELIGLISVYTDITDRKRVEKERAQIQEQMQEQAQRVQQIVDTVPEGVLLLDATGHVILANPLGEKELDTLANARVGDILTHLGDHPLDTLLTSPPKGLWHQVTTNHRNFQVIARSLETGVEAGGWVLVIRDVTQQIKVERRIHQQERLVAVGQLAAGIAHDFNNIMATIILYAQMTARKENLPDTVRERMVTINDQAQHATRLIQQILDFSRQAVLEQRPLDLVPLLKEHIKLLGRTLPESIEIELACRPDEHTTLFTVNADPTRMQQMITNLALNARDAMLTGGSLYIGLERIEVRSEKSPLVPEMAAGEWIKITVSDTGTGIPPDVLRHIFEPFFTTKASLGNGLGLAQVHGIVGQHEGRIEVETQIGEGTTFTIYLPALSVSEEPSDVFSKPPSPLLLGQGQTILVVEDAADVRQALIQSLETLNYNMLQATNGQKALAMLEQHGDEIDLLLSDVVMPVMGGKALLYALREKGWTMPVVMLTGHPLKKEMDELRAQGLTDWMPKPPELEQLAEVVARALDAD